MPGIWKGSIAFGLVNVPVELRSAVKDHRVRFHMYHEKDRTPIKYKRVRDKTGTEVPWSEIVRGHETDDGELVVLTEGDFEEAAVKQSHTIDILDFVNDREIDPRYYQTSYFLVPGKGGDRAYALLRDAMIKTSKAGIGKIIVHKRQHIAEVRADGHALVLMLLRFADELVDAGEYAYPPAERAATRELSLATDLVESLQSKFDPASYTDEYDANLRRILKAKAKGKRAALEGTAKDRDPQVLDLMERLMQSMHASPRKKTARKTSRPTRAPARKRKTVSAA